MTSTVDSAVKLAAAGVTELFSVGRIARMNKEFVLKMRISG